MSDQEDEGRGWRQARVFATIADAVIRLLELVVPLIELAPSELNSEGAWLN